MSDRATPAVSVVVPTRARPELLDRTISSIRAQDFDGGVECIVVHDQPQLPPAVPATDGGAIHIRHLPNGRSPGLAGARNTGILAARAPLVAFCDDDDVWDPHKLRLQTALLAGSDSVLVVGCANTVVYGASRTVRVAPGPQVTFAQLLRSRIAVLHSSTILVRREALVDRIGLIAEDIPGGGSEDYEWQLRAARVAPIAMVDTPLVEILWHEGSHYSRRWDVYVAGLEHILSRYPQFRRERRGRSRVYGQIAFGYAAMGRVSEARQWAVRSIWSDVTQPRGYLAILVAMRLLSPAMLLRHLHSHGRGV
jgi:glycosyltransferase involved in cell wall biosynthesis